MRMLNIATKGIYRGHTASQLYDAIPLDESCNFYIVFSHLASCVSRPMSRNVLKTLVAFSFSFVGFKVSTGLCAVFRVLGDKLELVLLWCFQQITSVYLWVWVCPRLYGNVNVGEYIGGNLFCCGWSVLVVSFRCHTTAFAVYIFHALLAWCRLVAQFSFLLVSACPVVQSCRGIFCPRA